VKRTDRLRLSSVTYTTYAPSSSVRFTKESLSGLHRRLFPHPARPFWPPIHPAWLRSGSSPDSEYAFVAQPCQSGASTPRTIYLFRRGP